jgi:CubicO group peptidase (beta-lactamase class C family)
MYETVADAARTTVAGGIPACQVAIAKDGEVQLFEAFGDCTTASRFPIYSATKPITASAIWQLIGDGLLDVSRTVASYIPEFATNGKDVVTVEQVMLHTGGFPMGPMRAVEGADRARRLERFAQWRLDWAPGSMFTYHPSAGHWVLAELLERLRGKDFRDVIEERVTAPLGLPRILGIPVGEQDGYVEPVIAEDGDRWVVEGLSTPESRAAGVPGGGGIATAADVVLFHQAVLHDPKGLWDPEVLHDAKTNVRCTFDDPMMGVPVNRTLGLVLAGDDGKQQLRQGGFGKFSSPLTFGHSGAHFQYAWTDPASGISFCYLNNLVAENIRQAVLTMPVSTAASALT